MSGSDPVVRAEVARVVHRFVHPAPPFSAGAPREMFALTLVTRSGRRAQGTAAGWPSRGRTLSAREMSEVSPIVSGCAFPEDLDSLAPRLSGVHPAAAWACFVAAARLCDGWALREAFAMGREDRPREVRRVPIAGLRFGVSDPAQELSCAGHPTWKLKVRSVLDVAFVSAHRSLFPRARIRLDGNRALSPTDVDRLAESAGDMLEFLEEPTALGTLASLRWPLALDEALEGASPEDVAKICDRARITTLVLKPAVLGPERTFAWSRFAVTRGLDVVISGLFEDRSGLLALAALQAALAPRVAAGLGTGRFLEGQDITEPDGCAEAT